MRIFRFLRSYYLYFYFHTTELKREPNEDSFPFYGWASTSLLVMIFHIMTVVVTINALAYDFVEHPIFSQVVVSFRGDMSVLFLLMAVMSFIVTHFVCRYKMRYEEIESRLNEFKWLSQRSAWKLLLLPVVSAALFLVTGPLFY